MLSRSVTLLVLCACAESASLPGALLENHSATSSDLKGLERTAQGPFVRRHIETLRAVVSAQTVREMRWSATAGALSSRGDTATWTLPDSDSAELTVHLTMADGREVSTPFTFALVDDTPHAVMSASEALLATPMPVVDGGFPEVSGATCDLQYDTTGSVHLVFTTSTHPSIFYGKWNGSTWALELVDGMGFNTGGAVTYANVKVDGTGTPHVAYVRDAHLFYATKSGTTWLRERVDGTSVFVNSSRFSLALNAQGRPSILYQTLRSTSSGYGDLVFATRTAANTWSNTVVTTTLAATLDSRFVGDLLFDANGVAYFPATLYATGSGIYQSYLVSLASSTAQGQLVVMTNSVTAPNANWDAIASMAWAGTGRLIARTTYGVYDITLSSVFTSSTWTWSRIEQGGSDYGDLAWNGRPVLLHQHTGGTLELVTPQSNGADFWTWTSMGVSTGTVAALAVHPTTGVASICYQANGRVMFQ